MTHPRLGGFPTVDADDVIWLDQAQMEEVDRLMIEEFHIELVQMMENAGRNLAQLAIRRFAPKRVAVLVGTGGNGGGGLTAARHLHNSGVKVSLVLSRPAMAFSGVPAHQLRIVQRMGVEIADGISASDLVIDALIGYSLRGAPRGRTEELMRRVGDLEIPVLSLDVPSGIDATDGSKPGYALSADATMTLALPKVGLRRTQEVGELFLADISVPTSVYQTMGLTVPVLFPSEPIIRIS